MIAAFDDAAGFDDQNLVGATDGGEAVGDDEGGAAAHQVAQTFLNERFGFGVEAGSGFVENQDARIGEDGAGDGDALALAAGKFYAAFADDGVVTFFKVFGEFVDAGDAAGVHDFGFGGVGAGEGDVLANAAVEKKRFLQDDAELGAVGIELDLGKIDAVDQNAAGSRNVEGGDKSDDGGLPCSGRTDQAR